MRISDLVNRVLRIVDDPRYEEKRELWRRFEEGKGIGRPLVTVFSRPHDWASELGFDLVKYYTEPEAYLEQQLRIKLYQHSRIFDDAVPGPGIVIDFGGAFEPSLMGVGVVVRGDGTPWPGQPVLRDEADLERLRYPDFQRSGLMPTVHRFHDEMEKMVGEDIPVDYPSWGRSPWGVAVHMMSWQNILISLVRKPKMVQRLLSFLAEARMEWERERAAFLGREVEASSLYNDEVNARLFSPRTYREVIFPQERRLADFYREGISYFHSCADITPFLPDIQQLRGLKIVHISPWTDLKTAVSLLGKRFVLQKWMHPGDMVVGEEEKRGRLLDALTIGEGCRMTIVNAGAVRDTVDWLRAVRPLMAPEPPGL